MDCRTVRRDLVAYLDNAVSKKLKAEIEEHLNKCPDCTWEMRSLEASWKSLEGGAIPPLRPDFTARVMDRVRKLSPKASPTNVAPGADWPLGLVVGAVAVFLLVGFSVVFLVYPKRPPVKSVDSSLSVSFEQDRLPAVKSSDEGTAEKAPMAPGPAPASQLLRTTRPETQPQPALEGISPQKIPAVLPPPPARVPAPAVPLASRNETDREIIANLDMYENAEMLKDMDVVSDMDMLETLKESSS